MKTVQIIFVLVAYTFIASLVIGAAEPGAEFEFPTLEVPAYDVNFPGSCSGFFDCTEYLANVLKAIGKAIVFVITLLFNLVVYVFAMFALVIVLAVTGIPGAPVAANLFIQVPLISGIGIMLYRLIRKGDDDA